MIFDSDCFFIIYYFKNSYQTIRLFCKFILAFKYQYKSCDFICAILIVLKNLLKINITEFTRFKI